MAYFFLAMIVAFAVLATVYLWQNDFARETLDVVFPAIGAIALSLYLGVKVVWIDAPSPHRSRVPVALLHDRAAGAVRSMAELVATDPIEMMSEFAGAREFDTLTLYNAFASLRLSESLRVADEADRATADRVLSDLVEYAVLEWLAKPTNTVGYTDSGTIYLLQSGGGGGGQSAGLQLVTVRPPADDLGSLLQKRPISIPLPPRSTVRLTVQEYERKIQVRTLHSSFILTIGLRGGGIFDGAMSPAANTLRRRLHLPDRTPHMWMAAFMVELESGQSAFRRFSKQAKEERVWLERLHARFDADFSWDRLRHRLANPQ